MTGSAHPALGAGGDVVEGQGHRSARELRASLLKPYIGEVLADVLAR
jgi:hypothetical protein